MSTLSRMAVASSVRIAKFRLDQAEAFLPAPEGPPRAHVAGLDPYRILIVGDGVALGRGVRSHDLALPGHLARSVGKRMNRGVDVDLFAAQRLPLSGIVSEVNKQHPWRYDAIVIVTGANEALLHEPIAQWETRLGSAIADLCAVVSPGAAVVVCGIPATYQGRELPPAIAQLADEHAAALDGASRRVCEGFRETYFVSLVAGRIEPEYPAPSSELFGVWAESLARHLPLRHVTHADPPGSDPEQIESARQAAVDHLNMDTEASDPVLQRIVTMAKQIFGTESALFTVLDKDLQLHVARAGVELKQVPRSDSFCQYTILSEDGMIVGDAALDERFSASQLVTGEPHIRFYAGFPVESPDGERLGALCVFDSNPRSAGQIDLVLLRELALLVQNELWRYLPATVEATTRLRDLAQPWIDRGSTLVGPLLRAHHA